MCLLGGRWRRSHFQLRALWLYFLWPTVDFVKLCLLRIHVRSIYKMLLKASHRDDWSWNPCLFLQFLITTIIRSLRLSTPTDSSLKVTASHGDSYIKIIFMVSAVLQHGYLTSMEHYCCNSNIEELVKLIDLCTQAWICLWVIQLCHCDLLKPS